MKSKNIEYRMQNIGLKQKLLSPKFYQLNSSKTVGFTLVELIVVIVILAILWTIAFISFQWYSRNSRDSVRIADINSTKKSLEIFITKAWFYPNPDWATNITYSWAIVWTEGTLWENVIKNIESISKVITDPLTANEYTYSITSSKTEYQIWSISEWWWLSQIHTTDNTYASDLSKTSAVAYISWNYNEKFIKVNTWTTNWILAQPSIIATDIWNPDLANILSTKKLSYNSYWNYPHSYNTQWIQSGWFNYTNGNPIIFTWTLEELHEDNQRKLDFLTNLKQAYTSTDLATNPMYEDIMSQDTTADSTWAINLIISYINSNKWGIKLEQLALLWSNTISTWWESWWWEINEYEWCTWTWQFLTWSTTYWICNSQDIIICGWNWIWFTIAACNVWTNISWTWVSSYWYYFQWWNNYWSVSWWATTSTFVDTTWYGPWNYYSSTMFIYNNLSDPFDWSTIQNDNLWWDTTNTNEARQWPCLSWYHVPTQWELSGVIAAWWWWTSWNNIMNTLKLPKAWYRAVWNWSMQDVSNYWRYWSSSPTNTNSFLLQFWNTVINNTTYYRTQWQSIRCFKN